LHSHHLGYLTLFTMNEAEHYRYAATVTATHDGKLIGRHSD
jgi:hypothetical protein